MTTATQMRLYDDLDTLTILSLAAVLHDKKGFTKVAVKMLKKVHWATATAIVEQVLEATRYKTALHAHLWRYLNVTRCAREIAQDEQHHGMIIHGEDVYPVRLEIASEEDLPWLFANQARVRITAAEGLMKELNKGEIYCHVLLFATRGFDGIVQKVELKCEQPSILSIPVDDTHYHHTVRRL